MKRLVFISSLVIFTISLLTNNSFAAEKKNEETVTFNVSLDCQGCVNKIEGNISYEKGVKDLKVSIDKKECTVTFRTDKTDTEKLIKAFNKLGYSAEIKKEKDSKAESVHEGHDHEHKGHN